MDVSPAQMPSLLAEILGELRKQSTMHEELWGADEIAAYLKTEKSTVQSHYLGKDSFPEPIKLPRGGKRWFSKEVRAWASKRPRAQERR